MKYVELFLDYMNINEMKLQSKLNNVFNKNEY